MAWAWWHGGTHAFAAARTAAGDTHNRGWGGAPVELGPVGAFRALVPLATVMGQLWLW